VAEACTLPALLHTSTDTSCTKAVSDNTQSLLQKLQPQGKIGKPPKSRRRYTKDEHMPSLTLQHMRNMKRGDLGTSEHRRVHCKVRGIPAVACAPSHLQQTTKKDQLTVYYVATVGTREPPHRCIPHACSIYQVTRHDSHTHCMTESGRGDLWGSATRYGATNQIGTLCVRERQPSICMHKSSAHDSKIKLADKTHMCSTWPYLA